MSKWDFMASRCDPDYLEILRVLNSLTVLSTVNQMLIWLAWSTYCSAEPVYMQGITRIASISPVQVGGSAVWALMM
jgi:hypothetical protein